MLDGGRSRPDDPVDRAASAALGEILTLSEVAEYLKIPRKTAYKVVKSGDLRAFKAGKHWRVQRAELGAWIARQSTGDGGRAE